MKGALARFAAGVVVIILGAFACRQDEPGLDPRTPPNSPVPTKLDRPNDKPESPPPPALPRADAGIGASRAAK